MKKEIKFKYVLKNRNTNKIHFKIYSLETIEVNGLGVLFDLYNYEIISRLQFTGLKDKNGVDIYEGDIVRYVIPQDFITEYFSEVKFIEKESKYYPLACCGKNFEVVGNIYEN